MRPYHVLLVVGLVLIALSLTFGVAAQDPTEEPTPTPEPIDNPLGEPPTFLAGIYEAWVNSPHADVEAEAFVHWNADGAVPETCATCHSTSGYQDFLGADDSEAGKVDTIHPVGGVITCDACHNRAAATLTSVTFPSGVEITGLGEDARCMVCHQGRASGPRVDAAIADVGLAEDVNTVSADLSFINIHYYAAAASLYGADVHGGYEFAGNVYQKKFRHVEGYESCADCHSPHSLEVQVQACATCHEGVETTEDLRNIRMAGSMSDYDGDGDIEEGIAGEIETLQEILYTTIQQYAADVAGTAITYDEHAHPYFFIDGNANGQTDEGEAVGNNRYNTFTPLLLQATYNYQVTKKDPGNFAHNAKYHIELLYDSIVKLNEAMAQTEATGLQRDDPGHFNSTGEPFRHWDEDGEVPGTCAKCHTAEGLPVFLHNGSNIAVEPSDSLACSTCHNNVQNGEFTTYEVEEVTFPSGAKVSFRSGKENNLCLNCHQGRESTVSVNRAITNAGVGDDEVSESLTFRNIHYFAAGASLFGTEVKGAYEYADKEYNGFFRHESPITSCNDCHDQHQLEIRVQACTECHEDVETVEDVRLIRMEGEFDAVDYDGDGDDEEPIAAEIQTLHEALYPALQAYATNTIGTGIVYDSHSHPYWFIDTNGNGTADPEEVNGDNRFASWTPTLLRAAYNYQYVAKDPGAFAHNSDYILQVLYDSLEAIGGSEAVATFTRPPVED